MCVGPCQYVLCDDRGVEIDDRDKSRPQNRTAESLAAETLHPET